jgi:hypothetical protein
MASTSWIILNLLEFLLLAAMSLGLVGAHVRQAEKTGVVGLIGFLAFFLGAAMMSGLLWSGAFIFPWLATEAQPGLLEAEPSGTVVVGFLLTFVLLSVGGLLFGFASLRAGVLPRGAGVLLMVGGVLGSALDLLNLPFSAVVIGASLAWVGYALWSGSGEPALTAEVAA